MKTHIKKPIKPIRRQGLPDSMRAALKAERLKRKLTQATLGSMLGLPQMHISSIEAGKTVPRFDTLLDLVRVLGYDLMLVPYAIVPYTAALIRDLNHPGEAKPMYAYDDDEQNEESTPHDEV